MTKKVELPLFLTWKALKTVIGWPYSRTQTGRMMHDPEYANRRFPASRKLGNHRNSHPIWCTKDVLDYFKRHGLDVSDDITFS